MNVEQTGWNSPSEIPNSFIESAGYEVSGNKMYIPIGDNGYIYVSYEDCNIAENLYGITKATNDTDYDNIYQYNELCSAIEIAYNANSTYLCNVFDKKTSEKEYLTGVSLNAPETYNCKVYVNPSSGSKSICCCNRNYRNKVKA